MIPKKSLTSSQEAPQSKATQQLNIFWQDERFASSTVFCSLSSSPADLLSVSIEYLREMFKFALSSLPETPLESTREELDDLKESKVKELEVVQRKYVSSSKWNNVTACKEFFAEVVKERHATFVNLISMGFYAPMLSDDTAKEVISSDTAAQFEEAIDKTLDNLTKMNEDKEIQLSMRIHSCGDVQCLIDKIREFKVSFAKEIVAKEMNGWSINDGLRQAVALIHPLVRIDF